MFKTLLKQIGDYKRDAVLTPIFVILEVIMEVIIPMMMAAIIDYGLTGQSLKTVCLLGAAMIVMAGAGIIFWCGIRKDCIQRQFWFCHESETVHV